MGLMLPAITPLLLIVRASVCAHGGDKCACYRQARHPPRRPATMSNATKRWGGPSRQSQIEENRAATDARRREGWGGYRWKSREEKEEAAWNASIAAECLQREEEEDALRGGGHGPGVQRGRGSDGGCKGGSGGGKRQHGQPGVRVVWKAVRAGALREVEVTSG